MEPSAESETRPLPTPPPRPIFLDPRWLVLLPAVVVFLVYLPAVRYNFVWDDTIFLRDMPAYRDPNLWLPALFQPFMLSPNYFRPLAVLTFVVEVNLVGLNPALFHFTNILLHAINTGLVALLAFSLFSPSPRTPAAPTDSPWSPRLFLTLGAGLLYGLHPALIEGVAFISSRFDLLMTTLLLLALLVDLRVRGKLIRAILVGLLFLLAALAKEMAVAFALVLPLWHLAQSQERPLSRAWWERAWQDGRIWVYLAVLAGGLLYLVIRWGSLGYLIVPNPQESIPTGSILQRLLLVAKSLGGYILVLLWPFTSVAPIHYSALPVPIGDGLAWLSVLVGGLVVAGLVVMIRRAPRAGWLALAGILALVPVLNILPLELGGGNFMAERYLLFPLVLLAWAVVDLAGLADLSGFARRLRATWKPALLAMWVLAAFATLQLILPNWRDDFALWTWGAARAPRSSTPPTNLSLQYSNTGQYELALQLADQAIQLEPTNADAWDNAGLALFYMGAYTDAQGAFEKATEIRPESALYWNNLAGALRERGDLANAEKILLDQVLPLDPNLPVAYLNLGIVYLRADRPDLAEPALQRAVELLPPDQAGSAQEFLVQTHDPDRWLRLGDLLLANGQYQPAAQSFDQARIYGANEADVAAGLSAALIGMQDYENAYQVLNQALQNAPDDPRLYYNAGILARDQGDVEQARLLFAKAAELAPGWELPQQALEQLP
jgi:tetratricopeptide (TPR) repeat protein